MNRASSATGWVRNPDGTLGWTWNPLTGCLNHVNGMCKGGGFPCYAYRLAHGRLRQRYLANHYTTKAHIINSSEEDLADPFYPRFWEDRLELPEPPRYREYSKEAKFALQQKQRRGIFVCDMSDLFGIGIPENWTQKVMSEVRMHPEHRFYLLTKQPQNLVKFSPFPDNCWVGVTVTSNAAMTNAFYALSRIKAGKTFISFEPLLGSIGMNDHVPLKNAWVDWLIIGAQTKPYKPPEIEWVEEIWRAAGRAGIPVFMKDNLAPLYATHFQCYQLRQEMPK